MIRIKNVHHVRLYKDKVMIVVNREPDEVYFRGYIIKVDPMEMKFVIQDYNKIIKNNKKNFVPTIQE